MASSVAAKILRLKKMNVAELRIEWERVFGQPTKQRHRAYLWKRLARAIQGDTSPKLTDEEQAKVDGYRDLIRQLPPEKWFPGKQRATPKPKARTSHRLPPPGSVITRQYKGQELAVKVLDDGLEFEGRIYRSLSAIAREVTGTSWNGYSFFRLNTGGRS